MLVLRRLDYGFSVEEAFELIPSSRVRVSAKLKLDESTSKEQ
jgi:hypothetical protein